MLHEKILSEFKYSYKHIIELLVMCVHVECLKCWLISEQRYARTLQEVVYRKLGMRALFQYTLAKHNWDEFADWG